jgi:predicted transcriptional regulator
MPDEVPLPVRQLLRSCIDSYEELEALLALMGTRPRTWTADQLATTLNVRESVASKALADLAAAGLLAQAEGALGAFEYSPTGVALAQAAEALEQQCRTNRIAIMRLMNANALERVRGGAARAFADAFVIGKKKDDG